MNKKFRKLRNNLLRKQSSAHIVEVAVSNGLSEQVNLKASYCALWTLSIAVTDIHIQITLIDPSQLVDRRAKIKHYIRTQNGM